jgi:hypothetical protein
VSAANQRGHAVGPEAIASGPTSCLSTYRNEPRSKSSSGTAWPLAGPNP